MDVRDFDDYRLLRMRDVVAITGLSKNTILRLVKAGSFPEPIQIAPRSVAWRWCDIRDWLESRPPATGANWR